MKAKLRLVFAAMLLAATLLVTAGASSYDHCADQLKDLGLFRGTNAGYELDRAPTRAEAATMLVRLLGKEDEAKTLDYDAPFTDLADWQKPYVQYLYENGLTRGVTATTFDPNSTCSAQMYTTFLLRSLGYSDKGSADFAYADAVDFGRSIGLVDLANCNESKFLRDHVAAMSLTALNTDVKGSEQKLLEKLVADGAVAQADAKDLLAFFDNYDNYLAVSEKMNTATKTDMTMQIDAKISVGGEEVVSMSMPMNTKMDMNMDNMDQSKIAMTGTMKMTMDGSLTGEQQDTVVNEKIAYYYTDGMYYMNMGDTQKVKMAMSFEEALEQMGGMTDMQSSEPLCLIESIEKSGSTMTVTYSAGLTDLIDEMLATMGLDAETSGVAFEIKGLSTKVTISNDQIKSMLVDMDMSMTADGIPMDMNMSIDCKVNSLGSNVNITFPTDLDTYVDMIGGADAPAA